MGVGGKVLSALDLNKFSVSRFSVLSQKSWEQDSICTDSGATFRSIPAARTNSAKSILETGVTVAWGIPGARRRLGNIGLGPVRSSSVCSKNDVKEHDTSRTDLTSIVT